MYEVEVKVRADHRPVRERLEALGATPLGQVEQVDTYYDAPHRDFAATDEALRLRRETVDEGSNDRETTARITYKGPLVEAASKTREELETRVADEETAATLLERLGFEPAATVEKRRERFEHDGYTITLDAVAGLGEFVEVEREVGDTSETPSGEGTDPRGDAETVEPAREGAYEVLSALGLDPDEQLRTSYLELLLEADDRPPGDNQE